MTTLNVPNTLSNGSTADASAVQQNFDAIETHVNTELLNRDGSVAMTGQLGLVGDPTSDDAAARKAYVDAQVSAEGATRGAADVALDSRVTALEGTDITVTLTGDVTGSGTITDLGSVSFATTIAGNSVALGADTTGNFVAGVSAGSGISVSGSGSENATVTVSHADTSSQASVNNSGGTVIQDVTVDTYGHVTALGSKTLSYTDVGAAASSHTHDSRYYTESEVNSLLSSKMGNSGRQTLSSAPASGTDWDGASLVISADSGVASISMRNNSAFAPMIRADGNVFWLRDGGNADNAVLDIWKVQYRSLVNTSSRTVKQDIVDYSGATAVVDALRPVSFRYIEGGGETRVGLIAEEVAEVIPEAVDGSGGVPGLDVGTVVGVLVAGLKEANSRISSLEDRLSALEG